VVLDVLNAHLAPLGRRVGPDPSGPEARTVGGMIGADAAGARSLRYGTTADAVEALEVVFANGESARLAREPWPDFESEPEDFRGKVARKVGMILRHHADLIARGGPKSPRDRAGYALKAAGGPDSIDLARLVVGSEGTLALVTEATLKTVPLPRAQAAVVLPFARLTDASAAVVDLLPLGPSACELFDWRSISLARDALPAARVWLPGPSEAALVVEFEGDDPDEVADKVRLAVRRVDRLGRLAGEPTEATKRADCDAVMGLRRVVKPLLTRMKGPAHPVAFIEDVAVPPEALPDFIGRLQATLKRFDVSWTIYGHVGHGQLHIRPFLNLADPGDRAKLEPLAGEVYAAAWDLGGTISGEHGCGLVRTQFLRKQCGDLVHAFRAGQGGVRPARPAQPRQGRGGRPPRDDPEPPRHARPGPDPGRRPGRGAPGPVGRLGRGGPGPPARPGGDPAGPPVGVADPLGGVGRLQRVRVVPDAGARPADVPGLPGPADRGRLPEGAGEFAPADRRRRGRPEALGVGGAPENADLCMHCTACRSECPSAVDVSTLMIEAKAAYVQIHGLPPVDWILSRVDRWAGARQPVPDRLERPDGGPLAALADRAADRALAAPPPAEGAPDPVRPPGRPARADHPRPQAPGPRVAYFVDVFANHFDQELAEAVVSVLRRAGVNVYVPRRQRGSGMAALVAGDLDNAREQAAANLRILGNAVRDGYTVVCSEPTAALMLRFEYQKLTDDLDAGLVAANTLDVGQYLAGLAARGQLPPPEVPLRARVGYHQPCHLRSLDVGTPGLDLIRQIPEIDVQPIERGCSGMAGTYGLAKRNFRASLRAGRGLRQRLAEDDIEIGSTECGTCRMQMEQGSTKRTLHPIKLLSLGYGLNPGLQGNSRPPRGGWRSPDGRGLLVFSQPLLLVPSPLEGEG
jgi:FAD/FMN-containing dehydrogenase/Fe-S oxidoreductase